MTHSLKGISGAPCLLLLLCLAQPVCGQPTPTPAPEQSAQDAAASLDQQKKKLEIEKLEAEIPKLKAETKKASWEPWTTVIAPAVSLLSVIVLGATIVLQRKTSLDVQQQQAEHALEQKSAELIFGSTYINMAKARAALLSELKPGGVSAKILAALGDVPYSTQQAVSELGWDLKIAVFKEMAVAYKDDPTAILNLAREIFRDNALDRIRVPEKTATPAATIDR